MLPWAADVTVFVVASEQRGVSLEHLHLPLELLIWSLFAIKAIGRWAVNTI